MGIFQKWSASVVAVMALAGCPGPSTPPCESAECADAGSLNPDGGNLHNADGGDVGDRCEGVTCATPPANACASSTELESFEPLGVCELGKCSYARQTTPCPEGCHNGKCRNNPCAGVTCNAPPTSVCTDSSTLKVYSVPGRCEGGGCYYDALPQTCQFGCTQGSCQGDPCAGVSCLQPPAAYCESASILKHFSPSGVCTAGSCTYSGQSTTCAFGCAAGKCNGDPCVGVACSTPPAAACVNATTLRSFASAGTCAGGTCSYSAAEQTCPHGCLAGQCNPDPCIGVSCSTPPPQVCVGANTLRQYTAAGQCSAGLCSYSFVDQTCSLGCANGACSTNLCAGVSCATPPAPVCVNASTLRTFASAGSCNPATGGCSYSPADTTCASGCVNGSCAAPTCGTQTCNSPPANTCFTSIYADSYASAGDCRTQAGVPQCNYAKDTLICTQGCLNGACLPSTPTVYYNFGFAQGSADSIDLWNARVLMPPQGGWLLTGCGSGTTLRHLARYANGWVEEQMLPSCNGYDVAVSPNGTFAGAARVVSGIQYAERVNGTWLAEVVEPSATSENVSLTFSTTSQAQVAYARWIAATQKVELWFATRTSAGVWSKSLVISLPWPSTTAPQVSLASAVGPDNAVHFAVSMYHWTENGETVYVKKPATGAITTQSVPWVSQAMSNNSVGVGSNGDVRILTSNALWTIPALGQPTVELLSHSAGTFTPGNLSGPTWSNVIGSAGGSWLTRVGPYWQYNPGLSGFLSSNPQYQTWGGPNWSQAAAVYPRSPTSSSILGRVAHAPVCTPTCSAKVCGDDGCGGTCGTCGAGLSCSWEGTCHSIEVKPFGHDLEPANLERTRWISRPAPTGFICEGGACSMKVAPKRGPNDAVVGFAENGTGGYAFAIHKAPASGATQRTFEVHVSGTGGLQLLPPILVPIAGMADARLVYPKGGTPILITYETTSTATQLVAFRWATSQWIKSTVYAAATGIPAYPYVGEQPVYDSAGNIYALIQIWTTGVTDWEFVLASSNVGTTGWSLSPALSTHQSSIDILWQSSGNATLLLDKSIQTLASGAWSAQPLPAAVVSDPWVLRLFKNPAGKVGMMSCAETAAEWLPGTGGTFSSTPVDLPIRSARGCFVEWYSGAKRRFYFGESPGYFVGTEL